VPVTRYCPSWLNAIVRTLGWGIESPNSSEVSNWISLDVFMSLIDMNPLSSWPTSNTPLEFETTEVALHEVCNVFNNKPESKFQILMELSKDDEMRL